MLLSHSPDSWSLVTTLLHLHVSHRDKMWVSMCYPSVSRNQHEATHTHQARLCLLACYFHSFSLAFAKQVINGNHMRISCHTPTHAWLWFITPHFLAHKEAQHLLVPSAPFWLEVPSLPRCLKALRTKNYSGSKPAHTVLEQGFSLAIKTNRGQLSVTCIYITV